MLKFLSTRRRNLLLNYLCKLSSSLIKSITIVGTKTTLNLSLRGLQTLRTRSCL